MELIYAFGRSIISMMMMMMMMVMVIVLVVLMTLITTQQWQISKIILKTESPRMVMYGLWCMVRDDDNDGKTLVSSWVLLLNFSSHFSISMSWVC